MVRRLRELALYLVDLGLDAPLHLVVALHTGSLAPLDKFDELKLETGDMVFEPGIGHGWVLPVSCHSARPVRQDRRMASATPSPTPNPNALRFSLDVTLSEPLSASSAADAGGSPLLSALFDIAGVASVFGTADFITVTRAAGADWNEIVPLVQQAVADHL